MVCILKIPANICNRQTSSAASTTSPNQITPLCPFSPPLTSSTHLPNPYHKHKHTTAAGSPRVPVTMLPYASVPEVEAALGRNLTFAETLWFNYSATKSDYFLYCHNILFLFLIFSLVPLPLVFLELKRLSFFDSYKIQPKVRLSLDEMFRCYKDVMRMFFLVVGPLQLVSYPSIKVSLILTPHQLNHLICLLIYYLIYCFFNLLFQMIGIRTGLPLPSGWEILAQLLVYFLVEDYTNYWIHRFLHNGWGYEKIHRVHHEYAAPIGFAAPYAHWAEILILGIPSFLGPAMVPGHIITFWLWIALRQIEAIDTHSGYRPLTHLNLFSLTDRVLLFLWLLSYMDPSICFASFVFFFFALF